MSRDVLLPGDSVMEAVFTGDSPMRILGSGEDDAIERIATRRRLDGDRDDTSEKPLSPYSQERSSYQINGGKTK